MYRSIETSIWRDPWFSDLSPEAKTVFFFGITNDRQTACGAFEVNVRQLAFETGLNKEQVEQALKVLDPKVMWWPEHNVLWVRNFYKYQHKNSHKENFRKGAMKALLSFPEEVQATVIEEYDELDYDYETAVGDDGVGDLDKA